MAQVTSVLGDRLRPSYNGAQERMDTARDAAVAPSPQDLQELHQLLCGYRVSQAIYAVARLGIADLLAHGAQDVDELARATRSHAPALARVLRFLAGVGLFDEIAPGHFALTPLGAGLRAEVPGSRRPWALLLLDPVNWQPWGELLRTTPAGGRAPIPCVARVGNTFLSRLRIIARS